MEKITVFYTAHARKDLLKLEKTTSKKIVLAIEKNTKINPTKNAKALKGIFQGLFRYRVGNYRIVFECDENGVVYIVTILCIKHRKDIYKSK
ncbi:MAG: type II toxin-antitoxin system RelE/ParE family toxin [Candidatus Pacebacteria bacterium]|nr:type II toxin-antitoxin system RelE/ParE family toxin [Candidatus Paceibacterota bacterium]